MANTKINVNLTKFIVVLAFSLCIQLSLSDKADFKINQNIHQNNAREKLEHIQPKTEDSSDSDDGFIKSIWATYIFSLLGIAAFVVILVFLLRLKFGEEEKLRPIQHSIVKQNFQPQQQQQINRMNQEPKFEPRHLQQDVVDLSNNVQPTTPVSPKPYSYQYSTEQTTPIYYQQQEYQSNAPPSESQVPQTPPQNFAPFVVPPYAEKSPTDEPNVSDGPFKYLDKYVPSSHSAPSEEDPILPKRAVLRANTPYKIVEEKSKVDSENGSGMNTPLQSVNDWSYNYNNNFSYQNNAFNNFPPEEDHNQSMFPKAATNDNGVVDNRFVRALPRLPLPPPPCRTLLVRYCRRFMLLVGLAMYMI